MDNHNIEEIRADKKQLEKEIFDLCQAFEEMHNLKISRIDMTEVEPYLPSKDRLQPKLLAIELTIKI